MQCISTMEYSSTIKKNKIILFAAMWMDLEMIILSTLILDVSCSVVSGSLQPHVPEPTRRLWPWDCPGKNTGVGCHFLLQGIFLTQWLNPRHPHCIQILYHLSHQEAHTKSCKSERKINSIWYHLCADSKIQHQWIYLQNTDSQR